MVSEVGGVTLVGVLIEIVFSGMVLTVGIFTFFFIEEEYCFLFLLLPLVTLTTINER